MAALTAISDTRVAAVVLSPTNRLLTQMPLTQPFPLLPPHRQSYFSQPTAVRQMHMPRGMKVSQATGQQNSDIYAPLHDWITETGWRSKYFLSLTSGVMTVASHMTGPGPITERLCRRFGGGRCVTQGDESVIGDWQQNSDIYAPLHDWMERQVFPIADIRCHGSRKSYDRTRTNHRTACRRLVEVVV